MKTRTTFILSLTTILTLAASNSFGKYSGGTGTADDPYQIGSATDLLALAANTGDYDANFILTADINLESSGPFTTAVIAPDTDNSNSDFDGIAFTGKFDGGDHTISNLTINTNGAGNDFLGLFGSASGCNISNLRMENVRITAGSGSLYLGGLAGSVTPGDINNCSSTVDINGGDNSRGIGGLVGYSASGNISNCQATVNLAGGYLAGNIGGLAGYNVNGTISDCCSTGNVTGVDESFYLSGLVGYNYNSTISNCYSTVNVNGGLNSSGLGGLVGDNDAGGNINACYATGAVTSGNNSTDNGGLAGFNFGGTISNSYSTGVVTVGDNSSSLGGLVGWNYNATISNCYSSGTVTGESGMTSFGGLVGYYGGSSGISSSYFLDANCNNGLGALLTNAQMEHRRSFVSWDFVDIWQIAQGISYPKLRAFGVSAGADVKYSGGSGTAGAPYKIGTVDDLLEMAAATSDYDANFIITADIDLAGVTMNPIGNDPNTFTGVFDGNNHIIRNMVINTPSVRYIALFGWIGPGGQVKNLGVEDVNFTGKFNVAGLAGYSDGAITSCYATGVVVASNSAAGGLVGVNGGTLTSCYSTCSVSGTYYIGGLAGANGGDINSCYATGAVSGVDEIGGLVGYNSGTIAFCYSTGEVNGNPSDTGGLLGGNEGTLPVNCFWDMNTSDQNTSHGGTGKTTAQMQTLSTFTSAGWDFVGETVNGTADIWKMPSAGGYPRLSWQKSADVLLPLDFQVTKCTVTAGTKVNSDKISFSGTMDTNASDFNDANNSSDANFVKVTISDVNAEDMDPCVFTFPVNSKTWKKGKFSSTISSKPLKMSFAFDTKKTTFSFSASNVDLTGLSCPVIVTIQIGGSSGFVSLDETIINSTKKLIPYQLMMGAENSLMADKVSFKRSTKPDANSLTISGRFTTTDGPDLSNPMVITVGSQTFTVTGNQFLSKNGVVSCKAAVANEGPLVRVTAKLDYVKCTFTVSIKYASIIQSGVVDFGIDCFGVNLDGLETINLGP